MFYMLVLYIYTEKGYVGLLCKRFSTSSREQITALLENMNTALTDAVVRTLSNTHGAVRTDKSAHVFNQAKDGELRLPAKCYFSSDIRQSYCLQRKFEKNSALAGNRTHLATLAKTSYIPVE